MEADQSVQDSISMHQRPPQQQFKHGLPSIRKQQLHVSTTHLTYTPRADTDAPTMVTGAYDGVDSYVEGKRTFFAKFSDATGIDTSSGNEPTLSYSIDGTAQTPVVATAIGTCSNAYDGCWYSAQTVALSAGETISYEWS